MQHVGWWGALGVKVGELEEQEPGEESGKGQRSACHRRAGDVVTPEGVLL